MLFGNTYSDWRGKVVELTNEEISWFYSVVNKFKMLPEAESIEIMNRDHDELDGKHKEALGVFYTDDPKNSNADCFITIDNYFIHEQYESIFNGCHTIEEETLESVLAHEIAHKFQFRHCKRHTMLTEKIIAEYNNI